MQHATTIECIPLHFSQRQTYVKECCIGRGCIRVQGGHDMYNHSAKGVGQWQSCVDVSNLPSYIVVTPVRFYGLESASKEN